MARSELLPRTPRTTCGSFRAEPKGRRAGVTPEAGTDRSTQPGEDDQVLSTLRAASVEPRKKPPFTHPHPVSSPDRRRPTSTATQGCGHNRRARASLASCATRPFDKFVATAMRS